MNLKSQAEDLNIFSINTDFIKKINQINSLAYGLELTNNKLSSVGKNLEIITNNNLIIERNINDGLSRYPGNGSKYNSIAAYFELRKEFNEKTNFVIFLSVLDNSFFLNNFIILN